MSDFLPCELCGRITEWRREFVEANERAILAADPEAVVTSHIFCPECSLVFLTPTPKTVH